MEEPEENSKSFQLLDNQSLKLIKTGIRFIKEYLRLALSLWFLLPILPLLFGLYAYKVTKNFETTYSAKLTFMIQETSDPISQGITITPGMAGINNGTAMSQNNISLNPEKIKQLSKSDKLITLALFKRVTVDGKEDFFINHFLRIYQFGYGDSYFKEDKDPSTFSREQITALQAAINALRNSNFLIDFDGNKIFTISTSAKNEQLTLEMCNVLYAALSGFYITKTTEKAQLTYDFLERRLDSIQTRLFSLELEAAQYLDQHHNVVLSVPLLYPNRILREKSNLTSQYTAVLQNFEAAKFNLSNITPIFQVVDSPFYPLSWNKASSKSYFIIAIGAGIFFDLCIILAVWLYKNYGSYVKQLFKNENNPDPDPGPVDNTT